MTNAEDRRLRKKYGITLEQRNAMGDVCQICGALPKTKRLHVDHDHRLVREKIVTYKVLDGWAAHCVKLNFTFTSKKRNDAIRLAKAQLKTMSVRGILCAWCNRGLRFYRDDPRRLQAAASYLQNYHDSIGLLR